MGIMLLRKLDQIKEYIFNDSEEWLLVGKGHERDL